MMNKVVLVGELVRNITLQKTANGSVNSFIIATVRVPKDERKSKEVHFIYCKAFGKTIPRILAESKEGDILCVSGQVATTVHTTPEGEKDYRMEIWSESVKRLPEKMVNQKDVGNPSRMISDAIRHYDQWDYIGEKSIHTLEKSEEKHDATNAREKHLKPLEKILKEQSEADSHNEAGSPSDKPTDRKEKALA